MRDYVNEGWAGILAANGFTGFDAIWRHDAEWFEDPNRRRGGWSGVARCELRVPDGGDRGVFLKRQKDHITRTLTHPFQGIPTFLREYRNIQRYRARGIATLEPVYFACRRESGEQRAILITAELAGYTSLESLVQRWQREGWPPRQMRQAIIHAVAALLRDMHRHHLQHNCFYPKHVFLRFSPQGVIDTRVIDLEKTKWRPFRVMATLRDLYTLNRHSQAWRRTERMRFFLEYLQERRLTPRARRIWQRIAHRTRRKGRVREAPQAG